MTRHASVADAVGGTPLIRLNRVSAGLAPTVYVKPEFLNPGGSVKDRTARWMIDAAEREGRLRPGGIIVEGTSGNTGVGLAQLAAQRGYRIIVVVPDKTSAEKQDNLRAYGAELVITPSGLPREHPEHVNSVAHRIAETTPGAWLADQYDNPANPQAHRESTGPEIWADTGGAVTHFVAGIGTGGTITGTGDYLKRVSDGRVTVVGADPATSVYSGGDGSPFLVEAAGHYLHPDAEQDVWPLSFHPEVVDRFVPVADRDSILAARRLAREEGLLVGGSSGLAVAAGLRVAAELDRSATVVILLPDSGRSYLSKYHNDSWLRHFGFLDDDRGDLVADALGRRLDTGSSGLTVPSTVTVAQARQLIRGTENRTDQIPVVLPRPAGGPPTAISEVLGTVTRDLLDRCISGNGAGRRVVEVAVPVEAFVGTGESRSQALNVLDGTGADSILVVRDGRLAGVLHRTDLGAGPAIPTDRTRVRAAG